MTNGETYLSVKGQSQPRNIGLYVKECLGPEIASPTLPWTRLCQKPWFGLVYFLEPVVESLHHEKRSNRRIWLFQTVVNYAREPHRCELSYQVMEVSFGQNLLRHNNKKAFSNHAGNGEYLICQGRSYQKCNNPKPPNWAFMCSADSPFLYQ